MVPACNAQVNMTDNGGDWPNPTPPFPVLNKLEKLNNKDNQYNVQQTSPYQKVSS